MGVKHRIEDARPVPAAGVRDDLAGLPRAGRGKACDQMGECVVRHGEQDEVGAGDDGGDVSDRRVGEHVGGAGARVLAHGIHTRDPVTGPGEGGTEDSTHPTGADHTDPQTRRMPVALHGERPYPRRPAAGVHAKSRTQPRVGG